MLVEKMSLQACATLQFYKGLRMGPAAWAWPSGLGLGPRLGLGPDLGLGRLGPRPSLGPGPAWARALAPATRATKQSDKELTA